MNISKIYFDMDGVLADFDRGVSELCHMKPVDQGHSSKEQDDVLFEEIRKVGHFYGKLEPIPHSLDFFRQVYDKYGDKVEILTGIPKPFRHIDDAEADKREWIRKYFGSEIVVNIVFRKDKILFCKDAGCILIDDFSKTVKEWQKAGGTGILFKNAENAAQELERIEKTEA